MSTEDIKRLFFAMEVAAPWPEQLPPGRLLDAAYLHMTLAFLGNVRYEPLLAQLPFLPLPSFSLAPVGYFDDCLFLPSHRPKVVAWHVQWVNKQSVRIYQQILADWLKGHGYALDKRPFLEHVTMARFPFDKVAWAEQPYALPVVGRAIHLYESMGKLTYEPRWSLPLLAPIEPLSHTADIAFKIRGSDLRELYMHAQIALAFEFPPLTAYLDATEPSNPDAIVVKLNELLACADIDHGVPFKAVCYHGVPVQHPTYLEWEMIVDV